MQLLLRRAGRLAADAPLERSRVEDREPALALSRTLDGLPLALDQAGAYIVEGPVSPAEYLELYEEGRANLLAASRCPRRPRPGQHHFLALAFAKVEAASPATADLLRLGALLAPTAIPEEIFLEGAPELGDRLGPACSSRYAFTAMISAAHRLSLLQRDPQSRTLSIHRLVQDVIRDTMDGAARRLWAECAVRAVNRAFPDVVYSAWPACERLLPHALSCFAEIVQREMDYPESARLLNITSIYLTKRTRYSEAEPLYRRALAIREQALGPDHPDTATSLNNLAELLPGPGPVRRGGAAVPPRPGDPREGAGPRPPRHGHQPQQPGGPLRRPGPVRGGGAAVPPRPGDPRAGAGPGPPRHGHQPQQPGASLRLPGPVRGGGAAVPPRPGDPRAGAGPGPPRHGHQPQQPGGAATESQGQYAEAEPLFRRALAIREQALGPDHPDTATSLNNLADLYDSQGRYAEAEPLYRRALAIREQALGPDHPDTATSLNNLARLYEPRAGTRRRSRCTAAPWRSASRRWALTTPTRPSASTTWRRLYGSRASTRRRSRCTAAPWRSASRRWARTTPTRPPASTTWRCLYQAQGRYAEAEPLCRRALAICEQALGPDHPDTATSLNNLAELLQAQGRYAEAEPLYRRALAIREQALGPDHPDTATSLNNLARSLPVARPVRVRRSRCTAAPWRSASRRWARTTLMYR